jgi:malonyl-CoA O-methyltransferase
MSNRKQTEFNRNAYNLWSKQYDVEANSTIAVDDVHFPSLWSSVTGKHVLEIGCGTGRHTRRLVQAGNQVTAIEPSEGMLEVAQSKITQGNIQFIHADFLKETLLPSGAFDVVIVSLVLEHIGDLSTFFEKVSRHLKQGGKLYLSEIHPERIARGSQAHFQDPSSGNVVRLESFAHTASEIGQAAQDAGLTLTETRDIFGTVELSKLHPGWDKYLGKPMIKIWAYTK